MRKPNCTEEVAAKLKKLPGKPGCYIYKDAAGEVLYVGKALSLKNRVRSYFQASTRHGARIERMVRKVCDLEFIVVDSEVEALVLECNLIKQYRPPFNVRLRDDKSYPYVVITNEKFPRVMFTRKVRKDGSKYFGPYTSAGSVRETLQLLHKIFPLIPCGKSWSGKVEQRPCLYYHLGQCLGPCGGLADPHEYAKVVKRVEQFLSGKTEGILEGLKSDMKQASEELDFERAARIRNQLQSIENLLQRQKVLSNDKVDQDVIAVVKDERGAAIQMLYIRNGKLIGQRHFLLDGSSEAAPAEAVGEFVKQYYSDSPEVPREILLPVEIEERNIVEQWLRTKKGKAVTVAVPQGGEKLKLVEMAANNAEQAMATFSEELAQKEVWAERAMADLQEGLDLQSPPLRIEGYDISNIQGTAPVGSMVVMEYAEPAKAEYRRFKIRYHPESPNDFAMMHEVITRRLRAFLEGDEKFVKMPDLIMIDGGKGQLSAALKARDELGLTVPMVGLAKKMELIFVPLEVRNEERGTRNEERVLGQSEIGSGGTLDSGTQGDNSDSDAGSHVGGTTMPGKKHSALVPRSSFLVPDEYTFDRPAPKEYVFEAVELPLNAPGLMLLRKLRDEAHRFALTYHRKLREKRFAGSALDEIPGIGPRRRRLLLRTFGSLEGIRRASAADIAAVPTLTKRLADQVKEYLREE